MRLYLVHGRNVSKRLSQALVVLALHELEARDVIAREMEGFSIEDIKSVHDYPALNARPAVLCRITLPEPTG